MSLTLIATRSMPTVSCRCSWKASLSLVPTPSVPDTSTDRKSTRLNSSHTVIYTLSLHDALPIFVNAHRNQIDAHRVVPLQLEGELELGADAVGPRHEHRSEEHTSELQSHSDLHSFPTRRSSDLR